MEITQVKGTSETHPLLSDSDEFADFEIMPYRVATTLPSEPKGSYAREALLDGLALADAGITNAYLFGFVGATDTHVGASSLDALPTVKMRMTEVVEHEDDVDDDERALGASSLD